MTSTSRDSPVNYSLPNLEGGANIDNIRILPLSEQANLNGSIVDHLSPVSSTGAVPPLDLKTEPPFTLSDGPPPYSGTRQVKVPAGSSSIAAGAISVPFKAGKALSLPSGASHGGVLLKHIPYLPSGSVGVGPEAEGAGLTVPDSWDGSENSVGGGSEVMMGAVEGDAVGEEVSDLEQKVRVSLCTEFTRSKRVRLQCVTYTV